MYATTEIMRMALLMLAALCALMVSALAMPIEKASAHQTTGRTLIYVGGKLVKRTEKFPKYGHMTDIRSDLLLLHS